MDSRQNSGGSAGASGSAAGEARGSPAARVIAVEDLAGPAGKLEALLNEGAAQARCAALVCHPHPSFGGTMHNKVVYRAMKSFHSFGLPVLRFNFRGAGLSQGAHDGGVGEVEDVRAALDWIERSLRLPVLFAGFSFGSYVGLRACCGEARVKAAAALGLPARAAGRDYDFAFLAACSQPKLFLSGDRDQFSSREALEAAARAAAPPSECVLIAGADHFFHGHLERMQAALEDWIGRRLQALAET